MSKFFNRTIKYLLYSEYFIHISVAVMLLAATMGILVMVAQDFTDLSWKSILLLINNALLLLIVKEVLWTVIKFFKKEGFSISSFLFIGIISSIRQILLLEAEKSVDKSNPLELLYQVMGNSFVILILVISYYIFKKAEEVSSNPNLTTKS